MSLGGLALDFRYVLRVLAKSPGFTAVAVLSLAIGVGANTSIFGAVRYALLDPLPVDRPDELSFVYWTTPAGLAVSQYFSSGGPTRGEVTARSNVSYQVYRALREARIPGVEVFGFNFIPQVTVSIPGTPALAAQGLVASGNYFAVLRPRLVMGRGLTDDDDRPSAPPVAIVSHAFWRRGLMSDPAILGKPIAINGVDFAVVGVTAPEFQGMSKGGRITPLTDVTIGLSQQELVWRPEPISFYVANDRLWIRAVARIARSTDERSAAAALTEALRQGAGGSGLVTADKLNTVEAVLLPAARGVGSLATRAERPLVILTGVAGVVLLIACLNLAGLILARGVSRQRELSLRRALGAGRGRLVRQLLVESAVIGVAGAAVSLVLTLWTRPLVSSMLTTGFAVSDVSLPIDWRSFGMTALVSGAAVALFGLIPAVRLTGRPATADLRHQTLGVSAARLTLGRVLLALQIAISLPLLVGAVLLLRTVHNLGRVDVGFESRGLIIFALDPSQSRLLNPARALGDAPPSQSEGLSVFLRRLLERLEAIPGVESATVLENALVSGWTSNNWAVIDGQKRDMYMNGVGPRFFETMRIPLIAGRTPTLADDDRAPRVGVINETAARKYFGDGSPIGRRFRFGRGDVEVIGVAADSKYAGLRDAVVPTLYDPFLQRAGAGSLRAAVRLSGPVAGIETSIRNAVAGLGYDLPVTELRTQLEQIDLTIGRERLIRDLLGVFGAFALVLACIGLYGVTSYSVSRRTNEIGIRVALGARRSQVLWLILRQVLVLGAAGLAIGLPLALLASPLVGSFLYGLGPRDMVTIAFAAAALLLVALAAGWLPARRAARMEALSALRHE
jgi:predicted permease